MSILIIAGFILIIFFGTLLCLDSPRSIEKTIDKTFESAVLALVLLIVIVAVLTASSKKRNEKAT